MNPRPVIRVGGARTNNLPNVDVEIPKGRLVVFTGVSGSGKSSLAFDTIAAESQRLLNETYPAFIQNLMPHLPRPEVDTIEGLSASIVVDQAALGANPRSTVGTATDAWSLLRQLFTLHGTPRPASSRHLSFNDPAGMCLDCEGTGREATLDVDAVIDRDRSLNDGAITFPNFGVGSLFWKVYTRSGYFDNDTPVRDYSNSDLEHLLRGSGPSVDTGTYPMAYEGVLTKIHRLYLAKGPDGLKPRLREAVEKAATFAACSSCQGSRLNEDAARCTIAGATLAACHAMPVVELTDWVRDLTTEQGSGELTRQLTSLLTNLTRVGLGYLALDRPTATLSGGEGQRIRTVLHLDSALTDITYVFDEPAAGLHAHDTAQIVTLLQKLRDKGNTVIVVEHHRDVITAADHVIDLGTGAGRHGGTITFTGTPAKLARSSTTTGHYLTYRAPLSQHPRRPTGHLTIRDARRHNLAGLTLDIPLGVLTCITGVAGSGKSSLLACLPRRDDLTILDQQPIRGSRRSNPGTYTGVLDQLRDLYAKTNNVKPSLFSANAAGACPQCQGLGVTYIDTSFRETIAITCDACAGRRYSPDVLQHTVHGHSIADALALPISEAAQQFGPFPVW